MSAHWRDSARSARFFIFDFRAVLPLVVFLLHIRLWTFYIAVGTMIAFYFLEKKGYSIPVFGRLVRSFFAGSRKMASPWWRT